MKSQALAKTIRLDVVRMTHLGGSSHVGSCLSIADILAVLYTYLKEKGNQTENNEKRDRFFLSKGHAGAALYSCLARLGYFDTKILETHYQNGSILSGHVSSKVPGVELSTGSLGMACGFGVGVALGLKKKGNGSQVFVLMSDGELGEGSNWESLLFASHNKLDNFTVIIDYNNLQSLDTVKNTLNLDPLDSKLNSFGFNSILVDGHNHEQLLLALKKKSISPKAIICKTTKGKGVSFMENSVLWHYRSPQGQEYLNAIKEIEENA